MLNSLASSVIFKAFRCMPLAISAIFFYWLASLVLFTVFFFNHWTPLALADFFFFILVGAVWRLSLFRPLCLTVERPLFYTPFFFKLLNAPLSRSSILNFLTLVRPLLYPHFWTSLLFLQFLFIYFFKKLRRSTDVLYVQVRN